MSLQELDTAFVRTSIATNYNSMNEHDDIRQNTGVCDTIESLAITSPPESTGVTTFVQEACTAVAAVDPKWSTTVYPVQSSLQDIREYFRRPVCVRAANVAGGRGRFWTFNNSFSTLLSFWDNGLNRLKGAYGIRAKVVLTLQVAATPFHQGLICLSGQYGYTPITGCYDRGIDSCTATNLPHVVLDLSSDTSVQLHMPFLFVAEYASVRTSAQETKYCNFNLNNLCTVPSVAGMGVPTFQVYMHLEDIELFGATPQNVSTVTLTGGRKLAPVVEEFESDSHPFSSALHAAGRAVSFIAKGVPSLSSIGGPVSWALGKAAGVVRYFGYGKPAVTDALMRMYPQATIGEFNTDVATASMVLAATANNTTSINTNVGCSDVDEMSLSYITSRWGQINTFDYGTSSAAGTLLYATPINMLAFWYRNPSSLPATNKLVGRFSTATSNSIQPSHLMFAASSFKQWRGSLKFRFTFAKTKMHAGRVMVAFNPYVTSVNNTTAMTAATVVDVPVYGNVGADPFGYSAIFDLKDGNVFEFEVPYVSPIPYSNLATTNGALAMYVVNPLIGSSVVSSAISVVVEVAGGSDFELANPVGVTFPVHNNGTISVQSGRVLSEAPEVVNQLTMGEVITSVKQLIGIPCINYQNPATFTDMGTLVPPWFYQPTPSILVPAPTAQPVQGSFSYGGNWASCYGFVKGGTDVHVYNAAKNLFLSVVQLPNPGGYVANVLSADGRGSSNAPVIFSTSGSVHARLPGFFPTTRVNSWAANAVVAAGSTWFNSNPYASTASVTPYDSLQSVYVVRGEVSDSSVYTPSWYLNVNAADDAQMAMYIGPPPVFMPPGPTANGFYDLASYKIQSIADL